MIGTEHMNRQIAFIKYSLIFILSLVLSISFEAFVFAAGSEAMNLNAADTGEAGTNNHDNDKVKIISRGKLINIVKHIEPGKYTAFMFYADWCAPCKTLKPRMEHFALSVDNLALREIDIIKWENPLVTYYNLPSVPYFIIYGPDGNFIERGSAITDETLKELTGGD
jgi:thiol-disulfide isomerase/thioredoxin